MIRKAYRVVWSKEPGEPAILIAPTRGRALFQAMLGLRDAGYKPTWLEIRCRRAPEYDRWAEAQGERRLSMCLAEKWVAREAAEINLKAKGA